MLRHSLILTDYAGSRVYGVDLLLHRGSTPTWKLQGRSLVQQSADGFGFKRGWRVLGGHDAPWVAVIGWGQKGGQGSEKGLDSAFIPLTHSGFLSGLSGLSLSSFFASSTMLLTSSLARGFWSVSFATGIGWFPSFSDCSAASIECDPIKNIPRLTKIMKHSNRDLRMVSPFCGIQPCPLKKLMSTF